MSVDLYGFHKDVRPILQTYLQNARDRPLRIRLSRSFEHKTTHRREYKDNANDAYNHLLRNIDKCWELTIVHCGSFGSDLPDDAVPDKESFPSLRVLTLDLDTEELSVLPNYLRNALQCTPVLTTLKIEGPFPEYPVYAFDRLTQLDISRLDNCTMGILQTWLPFCTNLKVLVLPNTLDDYDAFHTWDISQQKSVPLVTDLKADIEDYPAYISPAFSAFRFPSLSRLSLRLAGEFVPEDGWPPPFLDALRSSCHSLKELVLTMHSWYGRREDVFPVSNILTIMPNLTSLEFIFVEMVSPSTDPSPRPSSQNSSSCQILHALTVGHHAPEGMMENGRLNEDAWRAHNAQNPSTLLPKLASLRLYEEDPLAKSRKR
ncbi:hypothetical protein AAF712_007203 [Marasmius tenuissimus]|uniref:Uncharacterized protein n=1 Tax=Marasmius tenuissimus TaxID=585030 RepID=A0ABR2ZWM3_9AGAR